VVLCALRSGSGERGIEGAHTKNKEDEVDPPLTQIPDKLSLEIGHLAWKIGRIRKRLKRLFQAHALFLDFKRSLIAGRWGFCVHVFT